MQDATVSMDIGAGTELTLTLQVSPTAAPEVAEDGTLVFAGDSNGLHTEVQSIEDGTARILTVDEESYSDSPVHEYGYGVQLPEGASLAELADGTVAVVQHAVDVPAAMPVDLTTVVPDAAEVDPDHYAANTAAPAKVMGPDDDGLPGAGAQGCPLLRRVRLEQPDHAAVGPPADPSPPSTASAPTCCVTAACRSDETLI